MSDTSGSAFPIQRQTDPNGEVLMWAEPGMTKRELFAVKLLPAVMQNFWKGLDEQKYACPPDWRDGVAQDACLQADALLRALAEPQPEPAPRFPEFNVYGADAHQRAALRTLQTRTWFEQLPEVIRTYVTAAVADIASTEAGEDDIPF